MTTSVDPVSKQHCFGIPVQSSDIKLKLEQRIKLGCELGEGVQWHKPSQSVFWTDILNNRLYKYELNSNSLLHFDLPYSLCSFAFTENDHSILCAFDRGIGIYHWMEGQLDWLMDIEADDSSTRLNDGRANKQGQFWFGSMVVDNSQESIDKGTLYCLNPDKNLSVHEKNIGISNGICWSPNSEQFYLADSAKNRIDRYQFDSKTGEISNKTQFIQLPPGVSPDGANFDEHGRMWSALWGGSKVVCFNTNGFIEYELNLPVSQPTCIAFGGENLDLLFVTSARHGLSQAQLMEEPEAGNLFVFKTNVRGLPEARWG